VTRELGIDSLSPTSRGWCPGSSPFVATACLNAAVFHRWPFRFVSAWNVDAEPPPAAKLAAVLSLTLWTGVIACGRLLAYL
jgi:hypothetical protein